MRTRTRTSPCSRASLQGHGPHFCGMWLALASAGTPALKSARAHSSSHYLRITCLWLHTRWRPSWRLPLAAPTTLQDTWPARCKRPQPPKLPWSKIWQGGSGLRGAAHPGHTRSCARSALVHGCHAAGVCFRGMRSSARHLARQVPCAQRGLQPRNLLQRGRVRDRRLRPRWCTG